MEITTLYSPTNPSTWSYEQLLQYALQPNIKPRKRRKAIKLLSNSFKRKFNSNYVVLEAVFEKIKIAITEAFGPESKLLSLLRLDLRVVQ